MDTFSEGLGGGGLQGDGLHCDLDLQQRLLVLGLCRVRLEGVVLEGEVVVDLAVLAAQLLQLQLLLAGHFLHHHLQLRPAPALLGHMLLPPQLFGRLLDLAPLDLGAASVIALMPFTASIIAS